MEEGTVRRCIARSEYTYKYVVDYVLLLLDTLLTDDASTST